MKTKFSNDRFFFHIAKFLHKHDIREKNNVTGFFSAI